MPTMTFDALTVVRYCNVTAPSGDQSNEQNHEDKIKGCVVDESASRFAQRVARLHPVGRDYTRRVRPFSHAEFRTTSFAND